jgi:hypothetical protein
MDFGWCSFENICHCNINDIIYQEAPTLLPKHSPNFYFEQRGVKRKGKKTGVWWPPYNRVDMPPGGGGGQKEHVALWTLLWYLTYSSVPKGKRLCKNTPQRLPTNPLRLHHGEGENRNTSYCAHTLEVRSQLVFVFKPISGSSGI